MNQEAKDYILNKYGEETLKGVENGTIFINDKTLNEMMPRKRYKIEISNFNHSESFNLLSSIDNLLTNDVIKEDYFIPVNDEKIDYYRWNFNHKVGDIVKFAEGGFDEWNEQHRWNTLKPELSTKTGTVIDCVCDLHAYSHGSAWSCKVDFDGEIVETLCGFFEKV
jgi:hypothetical protein